ncbi:MAG: hypothetical protein SVR94_10600 [Pseudomonadota bacterium]|nr:hypothetical protein [Pseudomonadota bacterium]
MPFIWPQRTQCWFKHPEAVLLFVTQGGSTLTLASNYPYEVWLDGHFIGDGGFRCVAGKVDYEHWNAHEAQTVVVRVHWLNIETTAVYYRCLFEDAFLWDNNPERVWHCYPETSIAFAAQVCAQLPKQNSVYGHLQRGNALPLHSPALKVAWRVTTPLIQMPEYIAVEAKMIGKIPLLGHGEGEFAAHNVEDLVLYVQQGLPEGCCYQLPESAQAQHNRFDKTHDRSRVTAQLPAGLIAVSYDLGQIALHRFELKTQQTCILCYSEVADITAAWQSPNRSKVHLADAVIGAVELAAPFGVRGCRYIHLIYLEHQPPPQLHAWRRQYPLTWTGKRTPDPALNTILEACEHNLIACVDGGIVDTCWRERVQWSGDIRMSGLAMQTLTNNPEVLTHSLLQIADSYEEDIGMVQGAWPLGQPTQKTLLMPTYHLAFCLAVLENKVEACVEVVKHSVNRWQQRYLKNGLIQDLPGWYFTDWDFINEEAIGRNVHSPHCVTNAWFYELCRLLDIASMIDTTVFNQTFKTRSGYGLLNNQKTSIHATAAVVGSMDFDIHPGIDFILSAQATGQLKKSVTAYYGYFVAKAIGKYSNKHMLAFIKAYYLPMAQQYHTLWEKCDDQASLAHGWSVGIAQLILALTKDCVILDE